MVTAESSRPMTPATVGVPVQPPYLRFSASHPGRTAMARSMLSAIGNADGDNGVDKFIAVIGTAPIEPFGDDMQ